MKLLFPADQAARAALATLGVGVLEADERGMVVYLNHLAEKLTGWRLAGACKRSLEEVLQLVEDGRGQGPGLLGRLAAAAGDAGSQRQQALIVRRDGQRFPIEYVVARAGADAGNGAAGVVVVFSDATEQRLMNIHLARVSNQDLVTGLLNRGAFTEHLAVALEGSREKGEQHVLLFLDLDQFKLVNDTCGHEAGDDMLQWVAALLREAVGERDSAARFGGDEFVLLLVNRSLGDGMRFAEDLRRRLREFSFSWGDKSFAVSAAIGLAAVDSTSVSPAQLLSAADHACYVAKDKGRGGIQIFETQDEESAQRFDEMNLVAHIHHKLSSGDARLFAQRIKRLAGGPPQGLQLEVLLRFRGADGSLRDPGKIIRATERFGLMPTVDRWVIRTALAQLKEIGGEALKRIHVCFINLSGLSLQDDSFLDDLRDRIAASGVPPHKIGFEITETAAVHNLEQARWFIQEVRSMGCRLSLDDFGTGVASYSYLKSLPVEYLKIDGGFVESMLSSPLDRAMVESINQISHVLGIQTVAESVGSKEILEQVRQIGIDHAQGFFIDTPAPLAEACGTARQSM